MRDGQIKIIGYSSLMLVEMSSISQFWKCFMKSYCCHYFGDHCQDKHRVKIKGYEMFCCKTIVGCCHIFRCTCLLLTFCGHHLFYSLKRNDMHRVFGLYTARVLVSIGFKWKQDGCHTLVTSFFVFSNNNDYVITVAYGS